MAMRVNSLKFSFCPDFAHSFWMHRVIAERAAYRTFVSNGAVFVDIAENGVRNQFFFVDKLISVQTIPLIFRCDASSEIGWGHFRRCYALAEIAQQSSRFKVSFLTRPVPKAIQKKISEIHAGHQILEEKATLAEDVSALHSMFDLMSRKRIVVCIDHYDWESEAFQELKQDPRVILICFDDGLKRHYEADFLINQNLDAESIAYSTSASCQKLLGPKYVMVREEIHTLRQHPTERIADSFQFLVTLGGGDRWGHTLKAVEAVKQSPEKFESHIVVGAGWPHAEQAKRLIGNHPRIHFYEDPSFFPQLMARADLAFCGAGMTTYELAYLGIPMLSVALVPHQQPIGQGWCERGASDHMGLADGVNAQMISERLHYWMGRDQDLEDHGMAGQKVVDGRGKFRVLERVWKLIQDKIETELKTSSA